MTNVSYNIQKTTLSLVQFTTEIICINHFVKDLINDGNYAAVIDLEHVFNFSTLRMNHGITQYLGRTPTAYIVSLGETDIDDFLELRAVLGFHDNTKYVFLGKSLTSLMSPDVTPEFISNSIFIDVKNGNIHSHISKKQRGLQLESINTVKSGNCYEDLTNVDFSRKIIKLYDRAELKVCLYKGAPYSICTPKENCRDKGIGIEFWQMILEMLNATAEFSMQQFPSENFGGEQYNLLYNGTCDVHTGDYFSYGIFDVTLPFFFDSIHWIVKAPGQKPRWEYAFEIFTLNIWITWLVSSIFLSVTLYITKKVAGEDGKITDGLLIISKHMLEQAQVLKPSTWSQLITIFTIIMSTFLMNLFYDSKFIFLLTAFKDSFSMSSTEDIMRNNLKVISPTFIFMLFLGDERVSTYLMAHLVQGQGTLDNVQEDTTVPYLKRMFLYKIRNYLDAENRPKLKMLEKEIFTRAFCIVLRRGDPLTRLVNRKLILLLEHGFATNIISKYHIFNIEKESDVDAKRLTLGSFQLPNALWGLGMILSLAVFLYEIKG